MQLFNNVTDIVKDDMEKTITKGSKVSVAAACFSLYAFDALKKQLESIESLRFVFMSPTFLQEKSVKEKREFFIPRLNREQSLYGTEFELHLRNKLKQKAIARECAAWIRKKVQFKSYISGGEVSGYMVVDDAQGEDASVYLPLHGFTTADLGCERGGGRNSFVNKLDTPVAKEYLKQFDAVWANRSGELQDVTDIIVEHIENAYNENAPEFIYFVTLYNIFKEFLENVSEDELPNEATGFKESKIWQMLYNFQRDAVLAIINKLEQYNGCILADSVGLGKTFSALAVMKYYQERGKSILVLCPKKLAENWNTYRDNYVNNPLAADRFNYTVLFHTDLSRDKGSSNGVDLARINWKNYDLVVIDESHNFRNGDMSAHNGKENRYTRLMNRVMKAGIKTKVLMLSATPVNNRFYDLKNQLALAYEGDSSAWDEKLETRSKLEVIFRQAQKAYNEWCELQPQERTTAALLRSLNFDFFKVLDAVTIARSRKHIQKYYDMEGIGSFPERLKPISLRPCLTKLDKAIAYNEIFQQLMSLKLEIYTPSAFIYPSMVDKYEAMAESRGFNLIRGREQGLQRLMGINLLKRLESSVHSFRLTLERIHKSITATLGQIEWYEQNQGFASQVAEEDVDYDLDLEDAESDIFSVGKKFKIELKDMDYITWRESLESDRETLELLISMIKDIRPEHDEKLQELKQLLAEKQKNPINPGNRKVLIFTAFADTAEYLYQQIAPFMEKEFGRDTALITGSGGIKSTRKDVPCDFNYVLTCFSPLSKDRASLLPDSQADIDVLIATDCISEGQNLQDCDYLVNYDIHWNPVRIIQRFGRIDRIGSRNSCIQLVNFWPDISLDDYLQLKSRVETRMKISVMTSTGDDDPINADEKGDLEYRRRQLQRLQEEVVDIEEMSEGISIMDLGLNEYRLDIMEYLKEHEEIKQMPLGLHAVVPATEELPPGTIFVLKNINDSVNEGNQNQLHPYYMVYISEGGKVVCDYLQPKKLLDAMRLLCRGKKEPLSELCKSFNEATADGANMAEQSALLSDAINSIMDTKEESDIDSLFREGGTTALLSEIKGIDDFELVSFLSVREVE